MFYRLRRRSLFKYMRHVVDYTSICKWSKYLVDVWFFWIYLFFIYNFSLNIYLFFGKCHSYKVQEISNLILFLFFLQIRTYLLQLVANALLRLMSKC